MALKFTPGTILVRMGRYSRELSVRWSFGLLYQGGVTFKGTLLFSTYGSSPAACLALVHIRDNRSVLLYCHSIPVCCIPWLSFTSEYVANSCLKFPNLTINMVAQTV